MSIRDNSHLGAWGVHSEDREPEERELQDSKPVGTPREFGP